jgi:hypothetical protein
MPPLMCKTLSEDESDATTSDGDRHFTNHPSPDPPSIPELMTSLRDARSGAALGCSKKPSTRVSTGNPGATNAPTSNI